MSGPRPDAPTQWFADLVRALREQPADPLSILAHYRRSLPQGDASAICSAFLRRHATAIARGGPQTLLSLSLGHGAGSPVTLAAEAWFASNTPPWAWLNPLDRPARARADRCVATFAGPPSRPVRLCALAVGQLLLSLSSERELAWWAVESGACLRAQQGPWVDAVASPNGSWLALCRSGGDVDLLLASDGSHAGAIPAGGREWNPVAWKDDRTLAVARASGNIDIWQIDAPGSARLLKSLRAHRAPVDSLASGGGRIVSCSADGTLKAWDGDSHEPLFTTEVPTDSDDPVMTGFAVHAVTPDGASVIATVGHDDYAIFDFAPTYTLEQWPLGPGDRRVIQGPTDAMAAFAPDGRLILVERLGSVHVCEPANGAPGLHIALHAGSFPCATAVLPSGELVTGHADGCIRFWDLALPVERLEPYRCGTSSALAFSPDGEHVVVGNRYKPVAEILPARGGAPVTLSTEMSLRGGTFTHLPTSDGRLLAHGEVFALAIEELESGQRRSIELPVSHWTSMSLSSDASHVAFGSASGAVGIAWLQGDEVRVLDPGQPRRAARGVVRALLALPDSVAVARGNPPSLSLLGHDGSLRNLELPAVHLERLARSADGRTLVGAGEDLLTWDVATTEWRGLGAEKCYRGQTLLAMKGNRVLVTGGCRCSVWDLASCTVTRWIGETSHGAQVAAVTPDHQRVLVAGFQGKLTAFDIDTGGVVAVLSGHTAEVQSLDICADGQLAASGDAKGTVRIWNLAAGQSIVELAGASTAPIDAVVFARNGDVLTLNREGVRRRFRGAECVDQVLTPRLVPNRERLDYDGARLIRRTAHRGGRLLVSLGVTNAVKAWTLAGEPSQHTAVPGQPLPKAVCAKDGAWALSAAGNQVTVTPAGEATILAPSGEVIVLAGQPCGAVCLACTPDCGVVMILGQDRVVRLWARRGGLPLVSYAHDTPLALGACGPKQRFAFLDEAGRLLTFELLGRSFDDA